MQKAVYYQYDFVHKLPFANRSRRLSSPGANGFARPVRGPPPRRVFADRFVMREMLLSLVLPWLKRSHGAGQAPGSNSRPLPRHHAHGLDGARHSQAFVRSWTTHEPETGPEPANSKDFIVHETSGWNDLVLVPTARGRLSSLHNEVASEKNGLRVSLRPFESTHRRRYGMTWVPPMEHVGAAATVVTA